MKKKTLAIVLATVIVVAGAIGGTLAWLTSQEEITNTFTVGNIEIGLTESTFPTNAKLVPGTTIPKDPTVTVKAGSEESFVFVMIENKFSTIGTLNISADWTAVATSGDKTIYKYKEVVSATSVDTDLTKVFTTVTVSSNATNSDLQNLITNGTAKIKVMAYAHQTAEQNLSDAQTAFQTLLGGTWQAV
ncbi:MAG: hypothetical protein GX269_06165 [Clostridiales bacterium]|nr:hypothetical protein [Clostridiales bacterium]